MDTPISEGETRQVSGAEPAKGQPNTLLPTLEQPLEASDSPKEARNLQKEIKDTPEGAKDPQKEGKDTPEGEKASPEFCQSDGRPSPPHFIADIVRRTGEDTFVVQLQGCPGFAKIQCYAQHVRFERKFDLHNCDILTYNQGVCPVASITLGPYSLKEGMYIDCVLRCPINHQDPAQPTNPSYAGDSQRKKPNMGRKAWGWQ